MKQISNYIIERFKINKDIKITNSIPEIEDKLDEILTQCVKDGDFKEYKLERKSDKEIRIHLPQESRMFFSVIKDIINVNLEDKYNVKKIDWNLAKSYISCHLQ